MSKPLIPETMFTNKNIITKVWIFLDCLEKFFLDLSRLVCPMDKLNIIKKMRKILESNVSASMIGTLTIDEKSG